MAGSCVSTCDFTDYTTLQLPGAREEAADHWVRMIESGRSGGYGWVRKSLDIYDDGGIYLPSVDHLHKVVWTGQRFSTEETDGAWSAATVSQWGGWVSATTPSLMGFGPDEDRFVVIGDGDEVVNITLFWRDGIPDDWEQLPNSAVSADCWHRPGEYGRSRAPCHPDGTIHHGEWLRRHDGQQRARLHARGTTASGSPVSVFRSRPRPRIPTAGHAQVRVEPRHVGRSIKHGCARRPSTPNSVPFVSQGSDLVYTCETCDRQWTIGAVDWTTGEPDFHYVVGDSTFNTLGAGILLDDEGRLLYGTYSRKTCILRTASDGPITATR